MKTKSIDVYVDHIVDMYYSSFDYMNRKLSRARIKDIIKYNIIGNYLKDYLYLDHHVHTLRGEIQTLLFKEQAKRLADTFIGAKNEERTFNEFKTFVKKDFITNFISYK